MTVVEQYLCEYVEILKAENVALRQRLQECNEQLSVSKNVVDIKEYLNEITKLEQEIVRLRGED